MGYVSGDVAKEGLIVVILNVFCSFSEPDRIAVALKRSQYPIYEILIIEIVIGSQIRIGSDAAATVNDGEIEATVNRPEGIILTQMPFSKNGCVITGLFEHFCHSHIVGAQ